MTTDYIVYSDGEDEIGADELASELGRLGAAAKRRGKKVQEELEGIERQRENARLGARVVECKLNDDAEVLAEEADQLSWILRGATPADDTPAAPVPPTTTTPPPYIPSPTPPVPPTPPPADDDTDDPDDDTDDGATQVNVFVTFIHWVQGWTPIGWLLAIIGAVLGLLVANATKGTFDDIVGFGRGMLVFFWFVFVTGLGFCAGGLLGSLFNRSTE